MDVIQTGTNIATVKISELPKSTETNGRATLATNEQTNQSEALELTAVADATQKALVAAQTANQSSKTALASAATANQAAQAADTARENIAGDLLQKSSMFTGAIMGKGGYYKANSTLFNRNSFTIRAVIGITKSLSDGANQEYVIGTGGTEAVSVFTNSSKQGYIRIADGRGVRDESIDDKKLLEVIIVSNGKQSYSFLNSIKNTPDNKVSNYNAPKGIAFGRYYSSGVQFKHGCCIALQIFNFPFSDEDASASWNGGHPELWRAPDAWRKSDSPQRVVVDLIPASLTPTVWKDISGQGNDIPYVPIASNPAECEMAYENMGFPDTIIGTGAPAVTPNFIGQRYVDTTNKAAYTAYGTSSASDWK